AAAGLAAREHRHADDVHAPFGRLRGREDELNVERLDALCLRNAEAAEVARHAIEQRVRAGPDALRASAERRLVRDERLDLRRRRAAACLRAARSLERVVVLTASVAVGQNLVRLGDLTEYPEAPLAHVIPALPL